MDGTLVGDESIDVENGVAVANQAHKNLVAAAYFDGPS